MFLVSYTSLLSFVMQDRMDRMDRVLIKAAALLASFLSEPHLWSFLCTSLSLFQSPILASTHPSTTLFFLAISLVTQYVQQT